VDQCADQFDDYSPSRKQLAAVQHQLRAGCQREFEILTAGAYDVNED
jgi:hypothetical protein